jgi:hypothetical protein
VTRHRGGGQFGGDRVISKRSWAVVALVIVMAVVHDAVGSALAGEPSIPYCAKCISSEIITPEVLVANTHDLPGFAGAKTYFYAAASASQWAHAGELSAAGVERETVYLEHEGFLEGVFTKITDKHRQAVSEANVFASTSTAVRVLAESVARGFKSIEKRGLKRFHIAAIPGSVGLGVFRRGERGAISDVRFSTGRCWFVVADSVTNATTRAQGTRAPVAAAKAIYRNARAACVPPTAPEAGRGRCNPVGKLTESERQRCRRGSQPVRSKRSTKPRA